METFAVETLAEDVPKTFSKSRFIYVLRFSAMNIARWIWEAWKSLVSIGMWHTHEKKMFHEEMRCMRVRARDEHI